MNAKAHLVLAENRICLQGEVDFHNVVSLYDQGLAVMQGPGIFLIDLSSIQTVDSALIALLIEWLKFANENKITLHFRSLPSSLVAILKAARIESLIAEHIPVSL